MPAFRRLPTVPGQPSIFNVAANARALGFEAQVDLDAVKPVEKHFALIAKIEGHPVGAPA